MSLGEVLYTCTDVYHMHGEENQTELLAVVVNSFKHFHVGHLLIGEISHDFVINAVCV